MATPEQAGRVKVTVVYAVGGADFKKEMLVPGHQTVGWVVNASGVLGLHPELKEEFRVGVKGPMALPFDRTTKMVGLDAGVSEGLRIEVYVPVKKEALLAARKRPGGLQDAAE